MSLRWRNNVLVVVLILIFLIGVISIQNKIAVKSFRYEIPEKLLYLPPAKYAQTLAMGYDALWADLTWIRLLQYFGGHYLTDKKYPQVERIFDVIFELDPYFKDAYLFASMIFSEEVKKPKTAIKYLEKGMKYLSSDWRLPFEAGFVCMENLKDYDKAKEFFSIATTKPGCPSYVERMIPYLESEAGRYMVALKYYEEALKKAQKRNDQISAEICKNKIKDTLYKYHLKILQDAIIEYKAKYGKNPDNLNDLVKVGILKSIPKDPYGGYYYIKPNGWPDSSKKMKKRLKLYLFKLRKCIFNFYLEHNRFPYTIMEAINSFPSQEPFGGEWIYLYGIGEIYSSSYPEF